jgi:hypothetical protein
MRNLHLLPIPEELKIELEHAAILLSSLYGVKVDILEFDETDIIVRTIQTRSADGKWYSNKELADIGIVSQKVCL